MVKLVESFGLHAGVRQQHLGIGRQSDHRRHLAARGQAQRQLDRLATGQREIHGGDHPTIRHPRLAPHQQEWRVGLAGQSGCPRSDPDGIERRGSRHQQVGFLGHASQLDSDVAACHLERDGTFGSRVDPRQQVFGFAVPVQVDSLQHVSRQLDVGHLSYMNEGQFGVMSLRHNPGSIGNPAPHGTEVECRQDQIHGSSR